MQVSSTNSLTWLQSASAAASHSTSAGSTDGQDLLDASGAEGSSPSSLIASLQSPSQQFSADSLSALISAQLDQSAAGGATSSETGSTQTSAIGRGDADSDDDAQIQPQAGAVHHHHHHGGERPVPTSTEPSTQTSAADASSSSLAAGAATSVAQLLAEV